MAAGDTMTFVINDTSTGGSNPQAQVTITENADGTVTFDIVQLDGAGAYLGDLRGFFFDIADETLIGSLSTSANPLITELQQGDDSVKNLGNGANMQGLLGDGGGYDVGVEIGTAGIGANGDDVRSFSFTLDSTVRDLTLADFANVTFGIRITSVGQDIDGDGIIDTSRDGSSKIGETTFALVHTTPDAPACVDENTPSADAAANGNIFDNDGADPVLDVLTVTGWSDTDHGALTVGTAHAIVDDDGANAGDDAAGATVVLNADGTWTIDASSADALSAGEEIQQTYTVEIRQDHYTDGAHLNLDGSYTTTEAFTVTVCGVNDGPVAQDDDFTSPDQCILEDGVLTANVLADNGNGADSDVDRLDTISVTGIYDGLGILVALNDGDSGAADGDDTAIVTLASGAKVTIHADGSFEYDTNGAFAGLNDGDQANDSFTYELSDNNGASDEATASVCVDGVGAEVVYATLPPTYTGTDDPNDHDGEGNPLGTTLTGSNNGSVVDNLYGDAGNDTINAQNGNDNLYGGEGSDVLNGENGQDSLYGGSGDDELNGGTGNDLLVGGYGADQISGENGNDTIRYLSLNDTNDTILGFVAGEDKIDLSAIDADSSDPDNDAFLWGGQVLDYPVVQANSVTWYTDGTDLELLADTDGDITTAEFHITLTGVTTLAETDFNTL